MLSGGMLVTARKHRLCDRLYWQPLHFVIWENMMGDFVNSKSMLTPAMAALGVTMMSGVLAGQFGLPGKWTGLIFSFILGTVVFADRETPIIQRALFYVINSLTIYTMAIGINEAGVAAMSAHPAVPDACRAVVEEGAGKGFFSPWFRSY